MKTLDEVIKACEETVSDVDRGVDIEGCYLGATETRDALHYLKEYHSDKAMWEADRKGILNWIEQYKEAREKHQQAVIELKHKEKEVNDILTDYVALKQYWAEQQANPALTWDELRQMAGKPVWVEALLYKQWAVIAYIDVDYIRFEGANLYTPECRIYMGEDEFWQAYRKELADGLSA